MYCKICGRSRANEQFSGKGHSAHICKDCAKLPLEKRNELQTLSRIDSLPFHLSREQKVWLERMQMDKREHVQNAAKVAFEMRYPDWIEHPDG